MAGAELRPIPRNESILGNRSTLIVSGALSGFGEGFVFALIVVCAYVSLLTDNLVTIGLVPALAFGLWSAGSLIAQWLMATSVRRLPWAFATQLIRAGMMALLAYIAYRENVAASDRLESFLFTFGIFSFFSGAASHATNALVRSSIDPSDRSRLLFRRSIAAALLGVLAGVIVFQVFEEGGLSVDRSFGFVFIAAAATMAGATFFVLTTRETQGVIPRIAGTPGGTPAHSRSLRSFRRFMVFRLALVVAAMSDGYLIVFGIRELDMGLEFLGYCVVAFSGALAVGMLIWKAAEGGAIARSSLQIASLLKIVPPLIAVSIPYLQSSSYYQERTSGNSIPHWMIVGAFVALGFASASIVAGSFGLLTSLSAGMASSFASISNGVLAVASLASVGAGWVADRWGFDALFATALIAAVAAMLTSGLLPVTASSQATAGPGVAGPSRPLRPARLILR